MKLGVHSLLAGALLLLLVAVQSSRQVPLHDSDDSSSSEAVDVALYDPSETSTMKRHSEGTFSNDYSKYLEDRRAQDFVQWLMNNKRSGSSSATKRHADGTYTSDVSSFLQDQAAKDFVTWLKSSQAKRE